MRYEDDLKTKHFRKRKEFAGFIILLAIEKTNLVMRKYLSAVGLLFLSIGMVAQPLKNVTDVKIGNFHPFTPYGICIVADDKTGMVIEPDYPEKYGETRYGKNDPAGAEPALTSPDYSYSEISFEHSGAKIKFVWGKFDKNTVIASLESDKEVELSFKITPGWPSFHLSYYSSPKGLSAWGLAPDGDYIPFKLEGNPGPVKTEYIRNKETAIITFRLEPGKTNVFTVGTGALPSVENIPATLNKAKEKYLATQVSSEGDWGNFAGTILHTLNNAELYTSDNKKLAHVIGRGWWVIRKQNADLTPYFVWDGFFTSAMSSLEDIEGARNTVRAIISYTTPAGFVPSYSHWNAEIGYTTLDRSMPPVGSLCVWKMHQRFPDKAFLEEVYPTLLSWHNWWPTARDGSKNGLLEWGSELEDFRYAMLETGWDDNVHYLGARMEGTNMNADAVDLNSLWSMDTEYLAKIAAELGKTDDVKRLLEEKKQINSLINKYLWNEKLGIYCSRYWSIPEFTEDKRIEAKVLFKEGVQSAFFNGMNFENQIATRSDTAISFNWRGRSPITGVADSTWSARFIGKMTVPSNALYRLVAYADDGIRIYLDNRLIIDEWEIYNDTKKFYDITLQKGKTYEVKIEYVQKFGGSNLRFNVYTVRKSDPNDIFLTRITAMNLYPLMSGAPDEIKAAKTLNLLYNKEKFGGDWMVPTVPYDDPAYPSQGYWRGYIWPPANYLIYEGVKRYASAEQKAQYIQKSVDLFMRNWNDNKSSGENYNSIKGTIGDHPHYTWVTLLPFLGVESLVDINDNFEPVVPSEIILNEDITLHNIPFGGKLYTIQNKNGNVTINLKK